MQGVSDIPSAIGIDSEIKWDTAIQRILKRVDSASNYLIVSIEIVQDSILNY